MNLYTISADFIEFCGAGCMDYWYNVLAVFNQDKGYKLCIDDKSLAIEQYEKLGAKYESIRFWMQPILDNPNKKLAIIPLPDQKYNDNRLLFATIASNTTCTERKLIVVDKQKYKDLIQFIDDNKIKMLDGEEAKIKLSSSQIVQIAIGNNIKQQIHEQ